MKVLLAPDKFKGTLTALEAARHLAAGWRAHRPGDLTTLAPMSDGGDGLLDVLGIHLTGATLVPVRARDTLGRWRLTRILRHRDTAYIETARLIEPVDGPADPRQTTSAGVGDAVLAAADAGAGAVVVGLGGTATIDGGLGFLDALGWRAIDTGERRIRHPRATNLASVHRLAPGATPPVQIRALVDVTAPLLGPEGSVQNYGPQKGLTTDQLSEFEAAMRQFAHIVERDLGRPAASLLAGAGAAGGLGFTLAAAARAPLTPGARAIAELTSLDEMISTSDLVITGEGSLDRQTQQGKAPALVAARARRAGLPVVAVAGRVASLVGATMFDRVIKLGPEGPRTPGPAVEAAAMQLAAEAESLVR